MRNRQMIVRWLMANTSAIDTRGATAAPPTSWVDADEFATARAALLGEVQRIKWKATRGREDAVRDLRRALLIRRCGMRSSRASIG
jgi:cytochrome c556